MQSRSPRRDGRQEVAPAVVVVDGLHSAAAPEAVEKIGAHRADGEQRQPGPSAWPAAVEALALLGEW